MGSFQKILLYIAFTLVMVAVFLYLLFPSDTLRTYIQAQVRQNAPDVSLEIGQVSAAFPPGLVLANVLCEYQELPLLTASRAVVRPALLKLLGSEKVVNFKIDTSDGAIDGRSVIRTDKQTALAMDAAIDGVALQEIAGLRAIPDYIISGLLSGTITYKATTGRSGSGTADLTVAGARFELVNPMFGFESFSFPSIEAQLNLSPRRLQLRRCNLNGNEIDGNISGSVMLRTPMGQSRLNLSGVLRPHADFMARLQTNLPVALLGGRNLGQKGLPFRITGTIDQPGFSLR
ncbi:MAG: type II secretion system protein GspN [Desulfosarcinaceae bacterium]|nr:type II secretion system protein GspN [Desulfosarcinaceae bacterium]